MKKGDWVVLSDGRVGQITLMNYIPMYSLVDFKDGTFARMTHNHYMKPLAPAVSDILTAVNLTEEK